MATHEEQIRNLKDNRVLFLRLLEQNSAAKFHEMLAEHPMNTHLLCSAGVDGVSL